MRKLNEFYEFPPCLVLEHGHCGRLPEEVEGPDPPLRDPIYMLHFGGKGLFFGYGTWGIPCSSVLVLINEKE